MGWGVLGDIAGGAKDLAGDAADFVGDAADDVGEAFDDAMDAAGGGVRSVGNAVSNATISDIGHTALDVAGMVPVIGEAADLANAGWYLAEGDKTNAALSAAGAIPFAGNFATGAKWAKKGVNAVDMAADGAKVVDKAGDAARVADKAGDVAKAGDKTTDAATTTARGADDAAAVGRTVTSKVGDNDISWKVDGDGRPVEANATIREVFSGAARSGDELSAQRNLPGKLCDDHAGHVIGHRFGLDQGVKNLFPQNGNFNTSAYKKLENEMADFVNAGAEVKVNVQIDWTPSGRPDVVAVQYDAVDAASGKTVFSKDVEFDNLAGQSYDRISNAEITTKLGGENG